MRALPALATVAIVGVGALLVLAPDEERAPAPERPPATTTSTIPRESPQLHWVLLSGSGVEGRGRAVDPEALGFDLASAFDLERQVTVARLRRTGPGPGSAQLIHDARDDLEPGERHFSASLRVAGDAQAWLGIRAYSASLVDRGRAVEVAAATSTPTGPGPWGHHEVSVVLPPDTIILTYAVHFEGEGEVVVDDVVDP